MNHNKKPKKSKTKTNFICCLKNAVSKKSRKL